MNTTWILVANRANARLFESNGPGKGPQLRQEIPHPEGRLTNHEMGSDRPGRAYDSHGQGRHAMGKEHDNTEQTAIRFAKQLSLLLDDGRSRNQFTRLVLVAEARFLGQLRDALSPATSSLVAASLDKDLPGVAGQELARQLENVILV
jgi:protein required for attachment to host cells